MMFFRVGMLAVLSWGVAVSGLQAGSGGWSASSFEDAERLAKQQKLTLLVHFYADWCGPCQKMEREVFSSADVSASLGAGLVSVKVNSDARRDLVSRYGVTSLPSDVFISPDGVVSTFVGATARSAFLNRLSQFAVTASATDSTVAAADQAEAPAESVATNPPAEAVTVVAGKPVLAQDALVADSPVADSAIADSVPVDSSAEVTESAASADTSAAAEEAVVGTSQSQKMRRTTLRRVAEKRLGIDGFSPVALTESSKWAHGQKEITYEYQGVSYRFSDAPELERFKKAPEKYIPVLHGCDPVAFVNHKRIESGVMELGTAFQDRVFFFSSEQNRVEFQKNPQRFARSMELTFFETSPGVDG